MMPPSSASLAQTGKLVLLMDADLRKSVLQNRLNIRGKICGLSHYLSGMANVVSRNLRREDITVLNRRVGSSARILLDVELKRLGIPASRVKGYDKIMKSHLTMAAAIAAKEADLAIGTERISRQIEDLDFIPLLEERFDLVIKKEMLETKAVQTLLKVLNMPAFRDEIARFSGNDYRDMGKIIAEV